MCHRVKVLGSSTLRLNPLCTVLYNAASTDAMNLHVLHTLPAIAEAQELLAVSRVIQCAQAGSGCG